MFEAAIAFIGWFILAIYALSKLLFTLYVYSMNVLRVMEQKKMTAWHWLAAGDLAIIAIAVDVLLNVLLYSVLLWDKPRLKEKEYTLSHRLSRLVKDDGFRGVIARAVKKVLDPFDPSGVHIK